MADHTWESLAHGLECSLCAPRPPATDHWDLVGSLSASSLYLGRNQTYRGHCQLIFDPRHVTRIDQLTAAEWTAMSADLFRAHAAIVETLQPDHVNVESLGNVQPHLHWHIVPRYQDDPRWGAPIWLTSLVDMATTTIAAAERDALLRELRRALEL